MITWKQVEGLRDKLSKSERSNRTMRGELETMRERQKHLDRMQAGVLRLIADIRAAVGDPQGRLMQDQLLDHCRRLRDNQPRWIRTSEQLPPEGVVVRVWWHPHAKGDMKTAVWDGKRWCNAAETAVLCTPPTFWLFEPITPEPPKENA